MERFSKDGKLIIPLIQRKKGTKETDEEKVRYILTEAYCPKGCSIIDEKHKINGAPGLWIRFKKLGIAGELIFSAIEGDFEKIVLSGKLEDGVKYELHCPHCDVIF